MLARMRARIRAGLHEWRVVPPVSSRHEVVLALAGAQIMSGVGSFVYPELRPLTVLQFVPGPIQFVWYLVLIIGGGALLLSATRHQLADALVIEWPAFLLLGCSSLSYALCLIAAGRGTAFVAATGYLMYATACLTRTTRILMFANSVRRSEAVAAPGA